MVGVVTCASFLATTVLATLHVVRTRAGPADKKEAHEQWIGQMEAVKV